MGFVSAYPNPTLYVGAVGVRTLASQQDSSRLEAPQARRCTPGFSLDTFSHSQDFFILGDSKLTLSACKPLSAFIH